jgi:hypothetical protein
MEAIVENGVNYTYNKSELKNVINNTIDIIENVVKNNKFQVSGKIRNIDKFDKNISKNQMKKIQKYCFWISNKPTLRRINTFFGILTQNFCIGRIRIKVSAKEEAIQNTRKAWLKAQAESEKLLMEYKKEKGNFYKSLVN